ncbi:MAG: sulfatase-like hydrolase/transferase, partial [Sedimenticolaceae bacterium]
RLYTTPPADGFEDLTVYLRHLENADTMLDELTGILSRQPRDGLLCWFGDHVPSMPQVYANLGYTDGRTDYLIWRQGTGTTGRRDLAVEDLGAALIDAAGLGTMG